MKLTASVSEIKVARVYDLSQRKLESFRNEAGAMATPVVKIIFLLSYSILDYWVIFIFNLDDIFEQKMVKVLART